MGILFIALATADSVPDRDSLPVYQAHEVITIATLPGARAETLSLRDDPGVALRHIGVHDYGIMLTPGFSGLPSRHTSVLIQGIPVNSPATGSVDLSLLPMPLVARGLATLSGRPELALWLPVLPEARLFAGGFGLAGAAGFARMGPGLVGLSFKRADNCYPYEDEFGRNAVRTNSDESQIGLSGLLGRNGLSALLLASATERGSPGPIGSPTPSARLSDTLAIGSVRFRFVSLYGVREALTYSDANMFSRTTSTRIGISCSAEPLVLEASRASALGTRSYSAKALFSTGGRDWFCRAGATAWIGPRSSLAFPLAEAGLHFSRLRAAAFCGSVPPALNDIAWPDDGFSVGNPTLRPERLWGTELGLELDLAKAWVSFRFVDDYIAWVPGDRWTPVNLQGVLSPEAGASLTIGFLEAGVTWNPVRWQGRRVAGVPDPRGWAKVFAGPAWFSLDYTGPRVTTPGGARELPGFLMLDAGLSLSKGRSVLGLSLLNLLDQTPQQVAGYPLPGRNFRIEISWR